MGLFSKSKKTEDAKKEADFVEEEALLEKPIHEEAAGDRMSLSKKSPKGNVTIEAEKETLLEKLCPCFGGKRADQEAAVLAKEEMLKKVSEKKAILHRNLTMVNMGPRENFQQWNLVKFPRRKFKDFGIGIYLFFDFNRQ